MALSGILYRKMPSYGAFTIFGHGIGNLTKQNNHYANKVLSEVKGSVGRYNLLFALAEPAHLGLGLDFFSAIRTYFEIVKSFFCPVLFK